MFESPNSRSHWLLVTVIVMSFFVASMFNVYPLSFQMAVLRPMFLMMVLLFWVMFQPRYVGIFVAFWIGLLADLILDTHLGQQAFCAVLMVFCVKGLMALYVKQLGVPTAWFLASLGLTVFQLGLWLVQYLTQNLFVGSAVWSLLLSLLSFPLVLTALGRFARY